MPPKHVIAGLASFFCEHSHYVSCQKSESISWHIDCETIPIISLLFHVLKGKSTPLLLWPSGTGFSLPLPLVWQGIVKSRGTKGKKKNLSFSRQTYNRGVFCAAFYHKKKKKYKKREWGKKSRDCHLLGERRENMRASNPGSTWQQLSNVGLIVGVNDISIWPAISSFSPNNLVSTNIKKILGVRH